MNIFIGSESRSSFLCYVTFILFSHCISLSFALLIMVGRIFFHHSSNSGHGEHKFSNAKTFQSNIWICVQTTSI